MSGPWFKFYPTDWQADPALRMCSAGARGLWMEIICLMHNANPYGHLLVNGQSPTDTQLGVLAGIPTDQITALLGELETAGVFSRTRAGVIYSRKMTRSARKAATARNNGRKGGNPSLCKNRDKSASDNPPLKPTHKPQKPEARSQNVKEEANASSKKSPATGSRLPEDWNPTPEEMTFARNSGLSAEEARNESEKFRDYWHGIPGAKGRKVDWRGTWRNWVRRAAESRPANRNGDRRRSPAEIARDCAEEERSFFAGWSEGEYSSSPVNVTPIASARYR